MLSFCRFQREETTARRAASPVLNPIAGASALADQAGAFRIEGVPADAAMLVAQADGYDIAQRRLTIDRRVDGIVFEQVLQFPVHRDGTVRLAGTVRGFKLDYVYFTLCLDGTTHVADAVKGCFPAEIRVTAPR